MENKDWIKRDLDDVVFEHRNRNYGAYILRKKYGSHIKKASFWGMSAFVLLVLSPIIMDKMNFNANSLADDNNTLVELSRIEKPPVVPPPPKLPLPEPPPQKKQIATIDFRPPVVKDNPIEEPIIPKMDDITVAVSTKTQDGEKINLPPIEEPLAPPVEEPKPVVKAVDVDDNEPLIFVQQKPEFKDGEKAMYEFLAKNIKYPTIARENGIQGIVFVSFVVSKDGSIRDIVIKRGIGGGCNEEAFRVVQMMPKWTPGKQNGKAVNVAFTLPIKFKLD
jgi:protein TonB